MIDSKTILDQLMQKKSCIDSYNCLVWGTLQVQLDLVRVATKGSASLCIGCISWKVQTNTFSYYQPVSELGLIGCG